MSLDLDRYYNLLLEKGRHRFFYDPLGKYRKLFWSIFLVIITLLLLSRGVYYKLDLINRVSIAILIFSIYKLGRIFGHKDGFLDGYNLGGDEMREAINIAKKKNTSIDKELKGVRKNKADSISE